MPKTTMARNREVAQLAPVAQLAELVLDLLDALCEKPARLKEMEPSRRYQLQRLASFFDSARRGSLEDVSELAEAHRESVTARSTSANRAQIRPPSLDDDYVSWGVVMDFAPGDGARELVEQGPPFVDGLLDGDEKQLDERFLRDSLLPFLDRLAHADEKAAAEPVEGWHSLHS